jgi:hypothetical protein
MPKHVKSTSTSYEVGYRQPPKKFRFRKGTSGNPEGKRKRPKAPNLKAHLQGALNKTVKIRSGKQQKTYTKAAAGIEQLVDQWAKGDRNARRDLLPLCEKLGIDLTDRESLEGALEDALSAEDEALLADFVRRHGGQYPVHADAVPRLPSEDENILSPPLDDRKLLTAQPKNSTGPQMLQREATSESNAPNHVCDFPNSDEQP